MPSAVDFFTGRCADGSPSDHVTDAAEFGLRDKLDVPGQPKTRAYLDVDNPANWIARVSNTLQYKVAFKGVDNCILMHRPTVPDVPAEREKSCDGILFYEGNIVFVELKERNHQWLENGIKQLKATISAFNQADALDDYRQRIAYVANSKRPVFQKGHQRFIDSFTGETGVVLRIQATLNLEPLI